MWKIIASFEFIVILCSWIIIYKKAKYDMQGHTIENMVVEGTVSDKTPSYEVLCGVTISHPYGSYTYRNNKGLYDAYRTNTALELTIQVEKDMYGNVIKVNPKPIVVKKKGC